MLLKWINLWGAKKNLFSPYADWNIEEALDNQLSRANVEEMDKEALVDALNKCRVERSLWDRFFSQYKEFDDFKARIDELQKTRNSVMHHKQMSKVQFDDYKKKLRSINSKLDRAIEILEDEIYSETKISDITGAIISNSYNEGDILITAKTTDVTVLPSKSLV